MELVNRFIAPGILFLLTLAFGFWLSHAGKPYNGILFNIHKLIALAGVVLAGIQFYKILYTFDGLLIIFLVGLALCVIALFASGALMSVRKLDYTLILTVHRVAPVILTLGCALALYGLLKKP